MSDNYDVVVCGAGSAGANVAYQLAKIGLKVALLDFKKETEAGANWINGIPLWMFERAGLPSPQAPELRQRDPHFSLRDPSGKLLINLKAPLAQIHMGLLNQRLIQLAKEQKVDCHFQTEIYSPLIEDKKVVGIKFRKNHTEHEIRANLTLDCLNGKRLLINELGALGLEKRFPAASAFELCDAGQQVRKIKNGDRAKNYLNRIQAASEDIISFLAVEGPWSVLNVQVNLGKGEVEFLAGAIALSHFRSASKIITDFIDQNQDWVGDAIIVGKGKIPLRTYLPTPYAPGFLAIGAQAHMVFPIHASGVGSSLVAGKLLAEVAVEFGEKLDLGSEALGKSFMELYHQELGRVQKFYGMTQKWVQKLSPFQITLTFKLMRFNKLFLEAGFAQKMPLTKSAIKSFFYWEKK